MMPVLFTARFFPLGMRHLWQVGAQFCGILFSWSLAEGWENTWCRQRLTLSLLFSVFPPEAETKIRRQWKKLRNKSRAGL